LTAAAGRRHDRPMFDVKAMIEKYKQDHQHPVNKALHSVGIPMIVVSLVVVPFNPLLGAAMFVFGWILQFVGHAFEGKMPTFMRDPRAFLIAPIWYVKKVFGGGV
jgi:uncharacterized membrane protein YGL010W